MESKWEVIVIFCLLIFYLCITLGPCLVDDFFHFKNITTSNDQPSEDCKNIEKEQIKEGQHIESKKQRSCGESDNPDIDDREKVIILLGIKLLEEHLYEGFKQGAEKGISRSEHDLRENLHLSEIKIEIKLKHVNEREVDKN